MAKFPSTITAENFQDAVNCVNAYEIHIKQKKLIKKIIQPLGAILFCLMSLLLLFGALYNSASAEDMIVFDKLAFLVDIWLLVSGPVAKLGLAWYILWPVMIVAAYVIPLVISALISLVIGLFVRGGKTQISGDTDAQKAKSLYELANTLSRQSSNYDDPNTKPYQFLFVGAIAALLVYAFYTLKMSSVLNVEALIGFAVLMVILFFLFGLLLKAFFALNRLFYKKKYTPFNTTTLDRYWLSVDASEAHRRSAEARRKEKEQEAGKAKQAAAAKASSSYSKPSTSSYSSSSSSSSSSSINEYDSLTWTSAYVRNNEDRCSDVTLSVLKVSKDLLAEGDYSGAAKGFTKVVRALELLSETWPDYYRAPLFANCFALSKIYAFGLSNKDSALQYARKACEYAAKCNTDTARRDLRVMQEFRDSLSASYSLNSFAEEYGWDFPRDILSMG